MKTADVRSGNYIEYNVDSNDKDLKLQVSDNVRIWKYKNIFAKGYTSKWSETVFVITEVKNNVLWTYLISDLNGEKKYWNILWKRVAKSKSRRI